MRNEQHNKTNKSNRKSEEEIFRTRTDMGDKQRMKEQRQKKGEQRVPYE